MVLIRSNSQCHPARGDEMFSHTIRRKQFRLVDACVCQDALARCGRGCLRASECYRYHLFITKLFQFSEGRRTMGNAGSM